MDFLGLIFIAIGLAMDCFTVSFSAGAIQKELKFNNALLIAFLFGLFQGIMPLIGWFCGEAVIDKISHIDHWIAFSILLLIGGKMIYEGFKPEKTEKSLDFLKFSTLLVLAVATSIDALAVGFSFAVINVGNIWLVILLIGIVSFLFSLFGVYAGKKLCCYIKPSYAEILGGVILVLIGIKILLDHLF